MSESRMMILECVSLGCLSVPAAVKLLRVLAEVESFDVCCPDVLSAASIEVYLN